MSRPIAPAGIAAAGLVVLLLGIVPSWWFVGGMKLDLGDDDDGLELSFGLTSMEACRGKQCGSMDYRGMPAVEDDDENGTAEQKQFRRFVWAGAATFWGGVMVVAAIGGALLLWLIRQRLPASPATIGGALAIGVAIAGTLAFVLKPEMPHLELLRGQLDLRMSLGFPLTLLGCAGCAIGGFLLARDERTYPPLGSPRATLPVAVAVTMAPACPRCNAPTIYVAEHQRHFCSSCRAYL